MESTLRNRKPAYEPVKFLDEDDLHSLDIYEYHSGMYTPLDNFLSPIYGKMANLLPNWLAPNAVTLVGLVASIISCALVIYFDPYLNGAAPRWVYLYAAFANTFYQVFDCLDGKQARRLHASSPLGQIFDHGCDSFNLNCILLVILSTAGSGINVISGLCFLVCHFSFATAQLVEYYSGVLLCGSQYFGVTEALFITTFVYLFVGIYGSDFLKLPLSYYIPSLKIDFSLINCIMVVMIIIISLTMIIATIQCLIRGTTVEEKLRGKKNLTRFDFISRFLPLIVMTVCCVYIMTQPIFREYPIPFLTLCGLSFSFFSTRSNISHLCRRPLTWRFNGALPIIIYTIFDLLGYKSATVMWICLVFIVLLYGYFVISAVDQIKTHLGIRALHLTNKSEKNN
ncbi:hypothetical protein WA158_002332 [Blastocystis sp. Blastoise]